MGNSLEHSVSIFDEWNGMAGDNLDLGQYIEDIEEYLEPLQREAIISNVVDGFKSVISI